jgi:sugar/nucleoside kinase (ribokinase family)
LKLGEAGLLAPSSDCLRWAHGSHATSGLRRPPTYLYLPYAAPRVAKIVSVTGAGDSLVAGVASACSRGHFETAVALGLEMAAQSLCSERPVNPGVKPTLAPNREAHGSVVR